MICMRGMESKSLYKDVSIGGGGHYGSGNNVSSGKLGTWMDAVKGYPI